MRRRPVSGCCGFQDRDRSFRGHGEQLERRWHIRQRAENTETYASTVRRQLILEIAGEPPQHAQSTQSVTKDDA